jgi:hypothetical protein
MRQQVSIAVKTIPQKGTLIIAKNDLFNR